MNWDRWNQRSLDFLQIGRESTPWRIYWLSWRRRWQPHITESWSSPQKAPTSSLQNHIDIMGLLPVQYIVCNAVLLLLKWRKCPRKLLLYYSPGLQLCFVILCSFNCVERCCLINGIHVCQIFKILLTSIPVLH